MNLAKYKEQLYKTFLRKKNLYIIHCYFFPRSECVLLQGVVEIESSNYLRAHPILC